MPKPTATQSPVVLCERSSAFSELVHQYAEALQAAAPNLGQHGMPADEFWSSGLFRAAVERLRGQNAATMAEKRAFAALVLDFLCEQGRIRRWTSSGADDRHDYELEMPSGRIVAIEAKGCLDGNNTNIFVRPPNANEFIIWSLCQNPGADPRHNVWSGIHTRLSAEIIDRRQIVDGLIVWDMMCGTPGRPCPKATVDRHRSTTLGTYTVPPPCLYLFPRTVPDPRSNPSPACWTLAELQSLSAFHTAFHGDDADITEVRITASIDAATATVCRSTTLVRNGVEVYASSPTAVKRAHA